MWTREPERRPSRFAAWLGEQRAEEVGLSLGVLRQTVYCWLRYARGRPASSNAYPPSVANAWRLVELARRTKRPLTLVDIFPKPEA